MRISPHPSPYDRALRSDAQLEQSLADTVVHRDLVQMFGEADYELLSALARTAALAAPRTDCALYLLPGIMGSQLGYPRVAGHADLLWLDPLDIIGGRLIELTESRDLQPLGAIAFSYLALRLRLRAAGYRVVSWDYDWRLPINTLGKQLAQALRLEPARNVRVVAHSMGGLVARAAMRELPGRIARLIALGTPHLGTPAPAQALRGSYATVRRLAAMDRLRDADQLAEQVFSDFDSLYDMLPSPGILCEPDLRQHAEWPATGAQLNRTAWSRWLARPALRHTPSESLHCIAGYGQRTVTRLAKGADQFIYEVSSLGDGTVPTVSAAPPGSECYYVAAEHSALPRSPMVATAVIELLESGACSGLARSAPAIAPELVRVDDASLHRNWLEKVDWPAMGNDERRAYLNQLNIAPPQYWPKGGA